MSKNKERELTCWQKSLSDILHDNALLKYMLSEIVDANQENDFLPVAEYFQNELLLKDEKVKIFLNQINEYNIAGEHNFSEKYYADMEKLEYEISLFQNEFEEFSKDFKSRCYKKSID